MAHPEQSSAAENHPTPEVSPQRAFFDRLFEAADGDMTVMVSFIDNQPEAVAFAQAYGEIIAEGDAESRATRKMVGDEPLFKDAPHKQVSKAVRGAIAQAYEGDDITRLTREKMWKPVFEHLDNMVENGWMLQHILETHEFIEANNRQFTDKSTLE